MPLESATNVPHNVIAASLRSEPKQEGPHSFSRRCHAFLELCSDRRELVFRYGHKCLLVFGGSALFSRIRITAEDFLEDLRRVLYAEQDCLSYFAPKCRCSRCFRKSVFNVFLSVRILRR
jgi:hypothetical protein